MYQSLTDAKKMAERLQRMEIVDGGRRVKPTPISSEAASEFFSLLLL